MKINKIIKLLIPFYGDPERFRLCLIIREFLRKHHMSFLGKCLKHYLLQRYGCELAINAEISTKTSFMHTTGVVIGEGVRIHDHVVIYSGVVIGRKNVKNSNYPIIESDVVLCAGCVCIGNIIIRKGSIIGANTVCLKSTDPGGVYVGLPARKLKGE